MTNEDRIVEFNRGLVAAWIEGSKESAVEAQDEPEVAPEPVFTPQVKWPEGTEYISNGPFFD